MKNRQDSSNSPQKQVNTVNNHSNHDNYNPPSRLKNKGAKFNIHMIPLEDKLLGCARIMPKQLSQDKEFLYSENMKFKERIKQLEDQNTRLKTRLNISEKQKQHIFFQAEQLANSTEIRPNTKSYMRNHQKHSTGSISLQTNNIAKRMFRDAKEEVERLKLENQRIKKSVKYTQVSELQIENQNLLQETSRLQKYIQQIINNTNYDQYQHAIQDLKKKVQIEKQTNKNFPNQIKKKDQQIQQLKDKLRDLQSKKSENQKRLIKQLQIAKTQLNNIKKNSHNHLRQIKDKSIQKSFTKFKNCQDCLKHIQDKKRLQKNTQILTKQNKELKQKQKQHQNNHNNHHKQVKNNEKIEHLNIQNLQKQKINQKKQQIKTATKNMKSNHNKQKQTARENNSHTKHQQSDRVNQQRIESKKSIKFQQKKQKEEQYQEQAQEQYQQDNFEQEKPQKKQQPQNQDYGDFQQEDDQPQEKIKENKPEQRKVEKVQKKPSQKITQKAQKVQKKIKKEDIDEYAQDFDGGQLGEDDDEEQVLFQKQQKRNKSANSKKINKLLKETITYKFMAQRYSYNDFENDLLNSGVKTFTAEDLAGMLSNQPFFLLDQQQQFLLMYCLGKEHFDEKDVVPLKGFLKKMRNYIGQCPIIEQEQQKKIVPKLCKIFAQKQDIIYKQLQKQQSQRGLVPKKGFIKVMKKINLSQQEIQYCLSQLSICSPDIDHLNYGDFIQRYVKGNINQI